MKNFEVNVSVDGSKASGATSDLADPGLSIKKLELPTPGNHGDVLFYPPRDQFDALWQSNLAIVSKTGSTIVGEKPLAELREIARDELVRLATTYSNQYGDFSAPRDAARILLAGHQPELFHPGVWFKNYMNSALGQRFDATAINLVVDNDLCENPSIRIPLRSDDIHRDPLASHLDSKTNRQALTSSSSPTSPRTILIPFDGPDYSLPFEERAIQDREMFESFGNRAAETIRPLVDDPIINTLWPEVIAASKNSFNGKPAGLANSIAAGRHRLESMFGLQTLEIPLSVIAETESFSDFVWRIISEVDRFQKIYNDSLSVYRTAYKLRSAAHPVPALERREQWLEIPFWIWSQHNPQRKRLYVHPKKTTFLLGDLDGWQDEFNNQSAIDGLSELSRRGIKIRPRALMTTLYSRLILSDLFLHGIGGGKYDQLTDLIACHFFGQPLPAFAVASATMTLPTETTNESPADILATQQKLRELRFQPDRLIDVRKTPAAKPIIARKYDWIERSLPKEQLSVRHQAIVDCNRALQPFVENLRVETEQALVDLQHQIHANQILGSREFSFCLFPPELIEQLSVLSCGPTSFNDEPLV